MSLGPQLREWFACIRGNISAAGGPAPLPPPAPAPPKPPHPDCNTCWDDEAHGADVKITDQGLQARWPIAHASPPGIPNPTGCNEGVRTRLPIQPASGLATTFLAAQALKDAPFYGAIGFCTAATNLSTIGHYKTLATNMSWMYHSTGKLIGGNLSIPVTPWGQVAPANPPVGVSHANVSATFTTNTTIGEGVAGYSAEFFLNGVFVGSLRVQFPVANGDEAGIELYGCATSCANATIIALAQC